MKNKVFYQYRNIFFLLFLFFFAKATYSQWTSLDIGNCQHISCIHCPTDETCYIVGSYGKIQKTTDGGMTWITQVSNTTKNLTHCYFIDTLIGYICGADGIVLKTTNGGDSWINISVDDNQYWFWGVTFTDTITGYVAGDVGKVYKTSDGGNNWNILSNTSSGSISTIQFINDTTGFITCGSSSYINKTTNAGLTWQYISISGFASTITTIHFPNDNYGYAISGNGEVAQTKDVGVTWITKTDINPSNVIWDCFFVDSITGYCVSNDGHIYITTNGGDFWTTSAWLSTNSLNNIYFLSKYIGYAVGTFGTVLKYDNSSGIDFKNLNYSEEIEIFPNPMTNYSILEFDSYNHYYILELYNASGDKVKSYSINNKKSIIINRDNLTNGLYFFQLRNDNEIVGYGKLIIE